MQPLFRRFTAPGATEFHLRGSGNRLQVQTARTGEVTVYATLDDLTLLQREAFIEYLRAEGFVATNDASSAEFGECLWSPECASTRWLVDATWPDVDSTYLLHIRTLRWCALGVLVVWLTGMVVLVNI